LPRNQGVSEDRNDGYGDSVGDGGNTEALSMVRPTQLAMDDVNYSSSTLSSQDGVCVFSSVDGIAPPPSGLFVDTLTLPAEENLQAALQIFEKYPHLFKNKATYPHSQESKNSSESYPTCAKAEAPPEDVAKAVKLMAVHPF
jgi:hypothetical protein